MQASQFQVSALGGQATFSDTFDSSFGFGGKVSFVAREGLAMEFTGLYFDAKGSDNSCSCEGEL